MARTKSFFNPKTNIYTSPRPPLTFPSDPTLSMLRFFFLHLHSHPDRPALIDSSSSRLLTFRHLHSAVSSAAATLRLRLNISKSDVVLILAPNSILFPVAFLSVVSLGAVATTANPLYTPSELSKQALDSRSKLVLTVPELADKARTLNLPLIFLDDLVDNPSESSEFTPPPIRQDDTAALLYSSGTTGTSKGVVLTHGNFISASLMLTADQDEMGDPPNRFLCFLPMFHVFGLSVVSYAQLQRGNTVVVMERFEMGRMMEAVERYGVTHLFVVPPVMNRLAKLGREGRRYDMGSLRWICSGAAPLGGDVMEEVAKNFPNVELVQVTQVAY